MRVFSLLSDAVSHQKVKWEDAHEWQVKILKEMVGCRLFKGGKGPEEAEMRITGDLTEVGTGCLDNTVTCFMLFMKWPRENLTCSSVLK